MEKTYGFLIGLLAALAVVVCFYIGVVKDEHGPEITFGSELPVYKGDTADPELLSNVVAVDSRAGDVTDTVYVDCVRISQDGTRAKVTYVAVDKSNNVTRASQNLSCEGAAQQNTETQSSSADESGNDATQAANDNANESTDNPVADSTEPENPEAPVIKLNTDTVTLVVKDKFSYIDYVESITDNKDDSAYLSRRLHLDGDYRTKAAGTYEIVYSVNDSDGNASNEAKLTLIRQ